MRENSAAFGPFTITDSRLEFSALKVMAPDPVAIVDRAGNVFVYTWGGAKMDTGVVVPMPLPEGQEAVYEVLRVLGLRCAAHHASISNRAKS